MPNSALKLDFDRQVAGKDPAKSFEEDRKLMSKAELVKVYGRNNPRLNDEQLVFLNQ